MKTRTRMGVGMMAVALFAVVGTFSLMQGADAQTQEPVTTQEPTQPTTPAQEARNALTEARCTVAEARLDIRIQRVTASTEKTNSLYGRLIERSETIAANAQTKGYPEVNALNEAIVGIKTQLDTLSAASNDYLSALNEANIAACGESEGAFATGIDNARAQLVTVRATLSSIKQSTTSELIPALKAYLTWLQTNSQE